MKMFPLLGDFATGAPPLNLACNGTTFPRSPLTIEAARYLCLAVKPSNPGDSNATCSFLPLAAPALYHFSHHQSTTLIVFKNQFKSHIAHFGMHHPVFLCLEVL